MNLTQIAISNNRVTYVLLLIVLVLGVLGYNGLPRNSMPPFTIRVATIVTNFPGAGPERVELLITDKIEKVVQEIPEVDFISSTSRTGLSVISVSLKEEVPEKDLQPIWDRLRRKIDGIKGGLPSGIQGPNVQDEDIGVVYGIIIGLTADGFDYREQKDYAEDLRDKLIRLDDAAKVEIGGIIAERIFIDFDNAKLADLGLSGNQLKSIISGTNIIIPAGEINLGNERVILEPSGNLESLDEIAKIIVPVGKNNEKVFLGDITNVYRDYISPRESIVKINGKEGLALYISLKEGANIIQLGEQVNAFLEEYNPTLPLGLEAIRLASQDYEVDKSVNDFTNNVLQSILIVLLVMLLFLGFRTGLVVASLIPTALILTLLLMNQFEIGLNQVSLAALIMALGMLVDNAIVMAESMMVKMEKGTKGVDAAIDASKELMVPLLISSLTTSAAFLSFFLAESTMGEIMGPLFSVITLALLSSWTMALTIVPMFAVAFIRVKKKDPNKRTIFDWLNGYYNRILVSALKHPWILIGLIVASLAASLYGFSYLPFIFMPDSERNLVTLDMNLPLGTNIGTTESQVTQIEKFVLDELLTNESKTIGVKDWSSYIGVGPNAYDLGYSPGEQNSGYAHILFNTSSGKDNGFVIDKLEDFCFENLPDADVTIKRLGSGGGASVPVEIRLFGDEPKELFAIATSIKQKLYEIPGTKQIDDTWGPKIKKFFIDIDPAKLNQTGLTNQDIAVSLNTVLSGFEVGEFREDDNSIPLIMREASSETLNYNNIEGLNIFSQGAGTNVPLAQVATVRTEWQYAKILRRDLSRQLSVTCHLKDGYTATDITSILTPWIEAEQANWKYGYTNELGGESESSSDAMGAVIEKLPLAMFIIILLLVLQFNSIRKTTIVLLTIPLGIIGVIGGLLLVGSYFSFTGFLGIISLAGIVINNGIVLLDRIQIELVEFKRNTYDAIVAAANERFRPILLTTFTTSLGLIPLWLGGGAMWEPMAIGIIFGLLFATVITLLFVPVMYRLMYK